MTILAVMFAGLVIIITNAQVVASFHIQWCQQDDELPPLVKF
jgi:hypothetical protein